MPPLFLTRNIIQVEWHATHEASGWIPDRLVEQLLVVLVFFRGKECWKLQEMWKSWSYMDKYVYAWKTHTGYGCPLKMLDVSQQIREAETSQEHFKVWRGSRSWYPHLTIKWLKFWYQSMEACCFLSWIPWKQSLIQKLGRNLIPASCRLALLLASLCCTFKWLEKRVPQLPNLVHSSDDSNLKQWESVIPIFCMFKLHYRQCVRPCSFPSSTWELWGTAVTHRCFPLSQGPLGDPCSPQTSCIDFELCWELCRSFASWSGGLQMSRCLLKSDPHDPVSSGIVAAAHICGHC